MHSVLLLGCGKIGRAIARLLASTGDYRVCVADADRKAFGRLGEQGEIETLSLNATDRDEVAHAVAEHDSVISALSFRFNPLVAQVALDCGVSYFDLTEDVETTRQVRQIAAEAAAGQIFMPQCGLAPGFISILAYHLTGSFAALDTVHMRVGALPKFPSSELRYNLTWSTDGLINEYCNPCEAIHQGKRIETLPLEGLEHFSLDGVQYEAFNTSGGLGTLCETLDGRVRELNYRTIRYVGHRDLAAFLVNELRLGERRDVLKDVLERAVPVTFQDVVVIFCTVSGYQKDQFVQISDARKIYRTHVDGHPLSGIQLTTAAGVCAALDLHVEGTLPSSGFVKQEDVDFDVFIKNRFGRYYDSEGPLNVTQVIGHPEGGTNDSSDT